MSNIAFVRGSEPARTSTHGRVQDLARQHGVTYRPASLDADGNAIARLSDEPGLLDETGELLLELERQGHISADEADRLHAAYLSGR